LRASIGGTGGGERPSARGRRGVGGATADAAAVAAAAATTPGAAAPRLQRSCWSWNWSSCDRNLTCCGTGTESRKDRESIFLEGVSVMPLGAWVEV